MTLEAALAAGRVAPAPVAQRVALALGMVGSLGEELLAALVGAPGYRLVHVAMKQPIASATARFRPWVAGTAVIAADDAFVCLTDDTLPRPAHSPLLPFGAAQVVEAARLAQEAGARRLVVVAPLAALLQLNDAAHTVSSEQELALVEMRFETLLIVRPTQERATAGLWVQRAVASVARSVLEIMLPAHVQPLRPRTAALAILAALERTRPGVHVLGARELAAIAAETAPGQVPRPVKLR
jgi:hypothetical protein